MVCGPPIAGGAQSSSAAAEPSDNFWGDVDATLRNTFDSNDVFDTTVRNTLDWMNENDSAEMGPDDAVGIVMQSIAESAAHALAGDD